MAIETALITGIGGMIIGAYVMYTRVQTMFMNKRLKIVEKICLNFPSVEELATKILTMKIPMDKLPPEVLDSLKNEVNGFTSNVGNNPLKSNIEKENYFG